MDGPHICFYDAEAVLLRPSRLVDRLDLGLELDRALRDAWRAHSVRGLRRESAYLRLANPDVAEAVEALGALSATMLAPGPTLSAGINDTALRAGRTCYRRLAGRLGGEGTPSGHRASH